MNKNNFVRKMSVFLLVVPICGCCLFSGNEVTPSTPPQTPKEVTVSRQYRDDNFQYDIDVAGNKGLLSGLYIRGRNPSLEDLYNFAMTTCYNGGLRKKLGNGDSINKGEARLLAFVIMSNAMMINAMSNSMRMDILDVPAECVGNWLCPVCMKSIPDGSMCPICGHPDPSWEHGQNDRKKQKDRIYERFDGFVSYCEKNALSSNYYYKANNSGAAFSRALIEDFADHFSTIPVETRREAARKLKENQPLDDSRDGMDGWWPRHFKKEVLSDVEKACLELKGYDEIGDDWKHVLNNMTTYLKEFAKLRKDIFRYYSSEKLKDSLSKKHAEWLRTMADVLWEKERDSCCVYFYDLPFLLVTYRTCGEYRQNWKSWRKFSEKKGMQKAVKQYSNSILCTEVLKHVESDMAIDVYANIVEEVKGSLGEDEFNRLKNKLALVARAKKTNQFDNATGLPVNSFE